MKIAGIETATVRVPLRATAALSTRELRCREYVFVWMSGIDGPTGVGYTYAGTSGGRWLEQVIEELLAPLLIGRDAFAAEENWDYIYREFLLLGRRGALIRALSAVDIASWDLRAKTVNQSVRALLGGTRTQIPAYASGGYYLQGDAVENLVEEVGRYRALGFRDFKIKVGRLALAEDLMRVEAARAALGPHGRLALDANNAWSTVEEALRALDAFGPSDIWWIEEPFMPDELESYAELVRRTSVAVATGELESTRWGFARLIRDRAATMLQPDACAAGGITEWLKIALLAAAHDIPVAPHWHANLHAQLAATTSNCLAVEYFAPAEGVYDFERLLANPLAAHDGEVILGDEPGIGIVLDDDAIERFRVKAGQ